MSPEEVFVNSSANLAVLIAWVLPVAVGLYLIFYQGIFAAYAVVPAWIASAVIYFALSKAMQKPLSVESAN